MTTENQNTDGAVDDQQAGSQEGAPENNQDDANGGASDSGNPSAGEKNDSAEGGDDKGGDNPEPIEYSDFDLPEDTNVDEKLLGSVTPLMQELGIDQEGAQKLVTAYANHVQEFNQAQIDAQAEQVETWESELKNDKDLGGDKFDENMSIARKAVEQFGSSEFTELLDQTGLGSHPEVARFMVKVGKLIQEDNPAGGVQASQQEQDAKSVLFPNLK